MHCVYENCYVLFFFFNDTATTEIYTLSLHDALPICINMLKLNEELKRHGVFYPDDPASYPCSLVGGRIGTGGWSLLGARFGHTRDNVVSMEVVLPTGEIVAIGDGGGRKLRKSSTAFNLKQLFTGHQGTLGICTEATLELAPRPEVEFSAFFAYEDYMKIGRAHV